MRSEKKSLFIRFSLHSLFFHFMTFQKKKNYKANSQQLIARHKKKKEKLEKKTF